MNYKSFDALKRLYFVRTSGTKEEDEAADIIIDECKKIGVEAYKEEFEVDGYNPIKASLFFPSLDKEYDCAVVGLSGCTPKSGLEKEFAYVSSYEDARIQDIKDKICLVTGKLVNYKLYKALCDGKAAGLILTTGSVYKDNKDVDLDPYMYRERHLKNGKLPAVCIRMKDGEELVRAMPKTVRMIVEQVEVKNKSHNVVACIKGSELEDEIISFTAHYDSVSFSKGAYDNATGSTTILQLLAYFKEHTPKRSLRFVWCGSEECGLLGSKAYVKAHEDELNKYVLSINVDMTGVTLGYDIACCTSEMSLVNYINYLGMIEGFPISARQGVYSSDSTPFADAKVPALSFARISSQGGATIHSHDDVIDFLSEENYYRTCDFIAKFASIMINSRVFPVERSIPNNMVEEIDKYYGRKE